MASRYFVDGGVDNNWGTTGNWSLTDGGAGGAAVPLATDDVFFTSNSPNCTVNTSNRVALTFTTTGYTNTITKTFRISVSGAITLGSGTQWAGAEYLTGIIAATHTSNGNVVDNLWFHAAVTHTLADNFTVGNFRFGNSNVATVVNANQITITGNLDLSQCSTGILSGTTNLIMTGTGSILLPTSTGSIRNNLTFNTAGTITGGTGSLRYNTGTMTYTAGTVNMTATDLLVSISTTFALGSAVKWATINVTNTTTLTLTSDLWVLGNGVIGSSTFAITINTSKLYLGGGMTRGGTTGAMNGTGEIVLNGTGTVNCTTTSAIVCKLTIDAGAGTVTVDDANTIPVRVAFGSLKYVSGTVITDNGTWTAVGGGGTRGTPFVG